MAEIHESHGAGIQPRQRELLGLLLALTSAATLLVVAASARAWGGVGLGPGSLSIEIGSGGDAASSLKYFAVSQTPLQAVLLVGAVALVGSGPWGGVSPSARIARVLVLVVGVLVGVSAAYGALLLGPLDDSGFGTPAPDARASMTLLSLAISVSALVAARIAFGLLPIGEADSSSDVPADPGDSPPGPPSPPSQPVEPGEPPSA